MDGAVAITRMIDATTTAGRMISSRAATSSHVTTTTNIDIPGNRTSQSVSSTLMENAENNSSNRNDMNHFIARMYVHPFNVYPKMKITPAHQTRHLPQVASGRTFLASAPLRHHPSSEGEVLEQNANEEEEEEEWRTIWQHWNDILVQDQTNLSDISREGLLARTLAILVCADAIFCAGLGMEPSIGPN